MVFRIVLAFIFGMGVGYGEGGKVLFETYCWGCHHQSAEAFGPSFARIASMRNGDEIRAMISDPKSTSKVLGYSRNAMPSLKLSPSELEAITEYILSFKPTLASKETK